MADRSCVQRSLNCGFPRKIRSPGNKIRSPRNTEPCAHEDAEPCAHEDAEPCEHEDADIDKEGEQRSRHVDGLVMWTASSCGRRSAFLVLAQAVQGVVEHTAFEINISTLIQYITQSSYATFDPGFK